MIEIKLTKENRIAIPKGYKAEITDDEVIFEKIEKKFKDGDILTSVYDDQLVVIFKKYEDEKCNECSIYFSTSKYPLSSADNAIYNTKYLRPATNNEKLFLSSKLEEKNLSWNVEKKQIEKIRWRADEGKPYFYIAYPFQVLKKRDLRSWWEDDINYRGGNYFRTEDEGIKAVEVIKKALEKLKEQND